MSPALVPLEAPASPKRFEIPYKPSQTLENIKRVADFWTGGLCENARRLPEGLFTAILGHVLAKEEGRAIEADIEAREQRVNDKFAGLGK